MFVTNFTTCKRLGGTGYQVKHPGLRPYGHHNDFYLAKKALGRLSLE